MQIPFPPENPAETSPQKSFSLPHQNKNQEIQTLIYDGQSWLEIAAGALFQTLAVTDKRPHKAERSAGSMQMTAGSQYVLGWR